MFSLGTFESLLKAADRIHVLAQALRDGKGENIGNTLSHSLQRFESSARLDFAKHCQYLGGLDVVDWSGTDCGERIGFERTDHLNCKAFHQRRLLQGMPPARHHFECVSADLSLLAWIYRMR
jgi:hypothetical protein